MTASRLRYIAPLKGIKAIGEEQAMLCRGLKPLNNARQGKPWTLSLHPVRCAILLLFNQCCRPGLVIHVRSAAAILHLNDQLTAGLFAGNL